jgi:hypothetical protein
MCSGAQASHAGGPRRWLTVAATVAAVVAVAVAAAQAGSVWYDWEAARAAGAAEARRSTVVFCALARDCEGALAAKRAEVEALGALFGDWRLVVVTNNNRDGTAAALRAWAAEAGGCVVVLEPEEDAWAPQALEVRTAGDYEAAHAARIDRMAALRELYLQHVRAHWPGAEYVVVLDLDLRGSAEAGGLLASLGQRERRWSATFVNGRRGWRAYDSLAWVGAGTASGGEASQAWRDAAMQVATAGGGARLVEVASAFGGYAVYRGSSVLASSYVGWRARTGGECEHHTLHYGMPGRKWVNVGWAARFA